MKVCEKKKCGKKLSISGDLLYNRLTEGSMNDLVDVIPEEI